MSWSFRPSAWSVFGAVAGCALTVYLGTWQIHRGLQKQALERQYTAAAQQPPLELKAAAVPQPGLAAVHVTLHGRYLAGRQLLLDDQANGEQSGYHVWTPLRLDDGALVIVNRGWVPHGEDRRHLPAVPAPDGERSLGGLWRSLPEPGLHLAAGCDPAHPSTEWPRLVLYPTAADLACFYGEPLLAGEVLLAPAEPDGYLRQWRISNAGFPPSRHYAYAAQWFALALTLLVLFLKLNLKRQPDPT